MFRVEYVTSNLNINDVLMLNRRCFNALCLLGYLTTLLFIYIVKLQFEASNTDGLFTVTDSNSFLSPLEFLLMAQENNI